MQQAQRRVQHEHQVALNRGALFPTRVQAGLGKLDVPVAELVPEEGVQLARNVGELELVVGLVERGHQARQAAEDPAVGRRCRHRFPRLEAFQVHVHEARGVAHLVGEVTAADQLVLVELQVLRAGYLHQQAEAHAIGAVILHKLQRVHAVATALRHGLAVSCHNRGVDDNVLERDLVGEVQRRHNHARHPQAHDVTGGGKHLGGIVGFELGGVLRPALRGKRPQLRAEPGIQDVFVLMHVAAALGAHVGIFHQRVFPAAGIAVEHGDAMAPPQLTGNAPVLQVLQPVQVHLLPACRVELDGAVFHHFGGALLQTVHRNEPLLGKPGLQLGVAAVAGHDGMVVVFHVVQQAQRLELGHDGLARLVARHAAELAVALHDHGMLVEHVDLLQVVALAHGVVVRVVRGRGLHAAGAELGINIVVGEDGDLAADDGQVDGLAHQVLVALVLRAYGNAGVAQHGFGARGGHNNVFHAVHRLGKRVAKVPKVALLIHVLGLVVGDGGGAGRAPVHDAAALVDKAIVVPVAEHLAHRMGIFGRHGELLVGVVARAAHARDLAHDGVAVILAPIPAGVDELLAPDLQAGNALFSELLVYLGLGGDAGMVGTKDPTGLVALHAGMADAGVLDGVVQGMAHVQHAGNVRGRDNDGVGIGAVLAEARRALKISLFLPGVEKRLFPVLVRLIALFV